jgi:hypothetical protein
VRGIVRPPVCKLHSRQTEDSTPKADARNPVSSSKSDICSSVGGPQIRSANFSLAEVTKLMAEEAQICVDPSIYDRPYGFSALLTISVRAPGRRIRMPAPVVESVQAAGSSRPFVANVGRLERPSFIGTLRYRSPHRSAPRRKTLAFGCHKRGRRRKPPASMIALWFSTSLVETRAMRCNAGTAKSVSRQLKIHICEKFVLTSRNSHRIVAELANQRVRST